MTKSQRFINAWNISRKAAAQFGGSVKSYFAEALKMTYAAVVTPVKSVEEKLLDLGLKVWECGEKRRIYINWWQFKTVFGFEIWETKRGFDTDAQNISKATAAQWANEKHFYDCTTGEYDTVISSYLIPDSLKNY
ncbi:hypothetical protein ACSD30_000742 [Escherichia coli]|nr:hypothetical protein [Escherichia coli]EJG8081929.1 hypothetical protein [Escherichia coli]